MAAPRLLKGFYGVALLAIGLCLSGCSHQTKLLLINYTESTLKAKVGGLEHEVVIPSQSAVRTACYVGRTLRITVSDGKQTSVEEYAGADVKAVEKQEFDFFIVELR